MPGIIPTIRRVSFPLYSPAWGSPIGLHPGIWSDCQLMAPIYCSLLPYWGIWIIKYVSNRGLTAGQEVKTLRQSGSFLSLACLHCPHFLLVAGLFRVLHSGVFLQFAFLWTISSYSIHFWEPPLCSGLSLMQEWSKEAPKNQCLFPWRSHHSGRN